MSRLDKSPLFTRAKPRKIMFDPPDDLKEMFAIEWRRAKRICKPKFAGITKPKFYIIKTRSETLRGNCRGGRYTPCIKVNGRWVNTQFVICLTQHAVEENPVSTIRHEIAHTITDRHGPDWKKLNHWLQNGPL